MSRHWRPGNRSDWIVIDGYRSGGGRSGGSGIVPVGVSAVVIGLCVGGLLAWSTRQAPQTGPYGPSEWNEVQAVPTRAPDAADVARAEGAGEAQPAPGRRAVAGQP